MQSLVKLLLRRPIQRLTFNTKQLFAGEKNYTIGPNQKYPRVADNIVWINISNNGQFERVAAFQGESLLTALQRNRVVGLPATCDGGEDINTMLEKPIDPVTYGPFCGNCQIVVSDPWYKKMGELHYLEERNLEEANHARTTNSRLACCVLVEKWMNEMIITVPPNEGLPEDAY